MDDLQKLRMLLPHWIEHNAEHASEFHTWAGRAQAAGQAELAVQIEAAAAKMQAANHDLEHALAHLGGAAGPPHHAHVHPNHTH